MHSLPAGLATRMEIPLITTLTAAQAAVNGIRSLGQNLKVSTSAIGYDRLKQVIMTRT